MPTTARWTQGGPRRAKPFQEPPCAPPASSFRQVSSWPCTAAPTFRMITLVVILLVAVELLPPAYESTGAVAGGAAAAWLAALIVGLLGFTSASPDPPPGARELDG